MKPEITVTMPLAVFEQLSKNDTQERLDEMQVKIEKLCVAALGMTFDEAWDRYEKSKASPYGGHVPPYRRGPSGSAI